MFGYLQLFPHFKIRVEFPCGRIHYASKQCMLENEVPVNSGEGDDVGLLFFGCVHVLCHLTLLCICLDSWAFE